MTRQEREATAVELRDWALELERPGSPFTPSPKARQRLEMLRTLAAMLERPRSEQRMSAAAGSTRMDCAYADGWNACLESLL